MQNDIDGVTCNTVWTRLTLHVACLSLYIYFSKDVWRNLNVINYYFNEYIFVVCIFNGNSDD